MRVTRSHASAFHQACGDPGGGRAHAPPPPGDSPHRAPPAAPGATHRRHGARRDSLPRAQGAFLRAGPRPVALPPRSPPSPSPPPLNGTCGPGRAALPRAARARCAAAGRQGAPPRQGGEHPSLRVRTKAHAPAAGLGEGSAHAQRRYLPFPPRGASPLVIGRRALRVYGFMALRRRLRADTHAPGEAGPHKRMAARRRWAFLRYYWARCGPMGRRWRGRREGPCGRGEEGEEPRGSRCVRHFGGGAIVGGGASRGVGGALARRAGACGGAAILSEQRPAAEGERARARSGGRSAGVSVRLRG